jgi:hypothetical protein
MIADALLLVHILLHGFVRMFGAGCGRKSDPQFRLALCQTFLKTGNKELASHLSLLSKVCCAD